MSAAVPGALGVSPLHTSLAPLSRTNAWEPWLGITAPSTFLDADTEHLAARGGVALADLSALRKIEIEGREAAAFLDRLMARGTGGLEPGRVRRAVWCDGAGAMRGLGLLYRHAADRFVLAAGVRDFGWLAAIADAFDVALRDLSVDLAILALAGPAATRVLAAAGVPGAETVSAGTHRARSFAGISCLLSGPALGPFAELWCPAADAPELCHLILRAGRAFGLMPMGRTALSRLWLEAGVPAAGRDYLPAGLATPDRPALSPLALGLNRQVDFTHREGIGVRVLARAPAPGVRFTGLRIADGAPLGPARLRFQGRTIGHVTAGFTDPQSGLGLAAGFVVAEIAAGSACEAVSFEAGPDGPVERVRAARLTAFPLTAQSDGSAAFVRSAAEDLQPDTM